MKHWRIIIIGIILIGAAALAAAAFTAKIQEHKKAAAVDFLPSSERLQTDPGKQSQNGSGKTAVTAQCKDPKMRFTCYSTYYTSLTQTSGVPAAFADLKAAYQTDSYTVSECHPLAHVIGRAAVAKYSTVAEAYQHGDSFCWSGYYHGVMEAIISKMGRSGVLANINSICDGIPGKDRYSFDYYNCVHGMGHGLMAINQDDVPTALQECDGLTGSWEEQSCYSGVYMENVIANGIDHTTKYLKPDDLMYPCDWVAAKYKQTCYLTQTSYAIGQLNGNFTKLFQICAAVESQFVDTCYQSLGRDASAHALYDSAAASQTCMLGKDFRQQSNCAIGVAKDFVSNFHSDVQAKQFCGSLPTADLRNLCNATVADYYKVF